MCQLGTSDFFYAFPYLFQGKLLPAYKKYTKVAWGI